MKYKKIITDKEKNIIALLDELSLLQYTLIDSVKDDVLEEYKGHHIGRSQWDIKKMYREVIQPFHSIKIDKYGLGIYSFWGTKDTHIEEDYRKYLLHELTKMVITDSLDDSSVKFEAYNTASKTLHYLMDKEIKIGDFVLLHGDLYNGNILVMNNRYALIDFEYVRFGPSLIEWAFLLFWDAIIENDSMKRELLFNATIRDLEIIKNEMIVTDEDIWFIFDLYLPVIVCCVLHYCEEGLYNQSEILKNGMVAFWKNEYCKLRKFFYEKD